MPLQDNLVRTLLARKIINTSTNVLARFNKIDFSSRGLMIESTFDVDSIVENKAGQIVFCLIRQENGDRQLVLSEDIIKIDDMTPEVIAESFDLNVDGTKKEMGKRRGRPLKYRPPIEE